jgi:predicted phosphodiesterase
LQLFKIEREWNTGNKIFPIVFMGDYHAGSPNCDYKLLEEHVTEISQMSNNTMVILMGDLAEWIIPGDKRFSFMGIDKRFWGGIEALPMEYLTYLEETLEPIAHMIEVVHDGNHESSMFPTMYPGAELCSRLRTRLAKRTTPEFAQSKLRYAPGECYTKIHWKWNGANSDHRSLMVNTSHGWQAGRQPGAKHNAMSQMFSWISADVIMRGHSHELFAEHGPPRETPNPQMTKLVETTTICGNTGSYLKTREITERPSYSEKAGYRPLARGYVRIDVTLGDKGLDKAIYIK